MSSHVMSIADSSASTCWSRSIRASVTGARYASTCRAARSTVGLQVWNCLASLTLSVANRLVILASDCIRLIARGRRDLLVDCPRTIRSHSWCRPQAASGLDSWSIQMKPSSYTGFNSSCARAAVGVQGVHASDRATTVRFLEEQRSCRTPRRPGERHRSIRRPTRVPPHRGCASKVASVRSMDLSPPRRRRWRRFRLDGACWGRPPSPGWHP